MMFKARKESNGRPFSGSPYGTPKIVQLPRTEGIWGTFDSAKKMAVNEVGKRGLVSSSGDEAIIIVLPADPDFQQSLRIIRGLKSREDIERLLESGTTMQKRTAINVLGRIRDPRSLQPISNLMIQTSDPVVKRECLHAILNYDWVKLDAQAKGVVFRAFIHALASNNFGLRPIAVRSIQKYPEMGHILPSADSRHEAVKGAEGIAGRLLFDADSAAVTNAIIALDFLYTVSGAAYARMFAGSIEDGPGGDKTITASTELDLVKTMAHFLQNADIRLRQKVKLLAIYCMAKQAAINGDLDTLKQAFKQEYSEGGETTKREISRISKLPFFSGNGVMDFVLGKPEGSTATRPVPGQSESDKEAAIKALNESILGWASR